MYTCWCKIMRHARSVRTDGRTDGRTGRIDDGDISVAARQTAGDCAPPRLLPKTDSGARRVGRPGLRVGGSHATCGKMNRRIDGGRTAALVDVCAEENIVSVETADRTACRSPARRNQSVGGRPPTDRLTDYLWTSHDERRGLLRTRRSSVPVQTV